MDRCRSYGSGVTQSTLADSAGSRDQAQTLLPLLAGALRALSAKPEQERMLARWLGQLSADQFASRCVRPIMRHVDAVAPQLVNILPCQKTHESQFHAQTTMLENLINCQACCMGGTSQDTRDILAAS